MRTVSAIAALAVPSIFALATGGCATTPPADDAPATSASALGRTTDEAMAEALPLLRYLNWFDVVARDHLDAACSDTEGRMAAGGTMTLVRYGANTHALVDVPWAQPAASVFAGGAFQMVHGSVGGGARGVEGRSVALDHYAVGSARALCRGWGGSSYADVAASLEGAVGAIGCGALGYPAATFDAAMVHAADAFAEAIAAATPRSPTRRAGPTGVAELVFTPGAGADAYFHVSVADLATHWVLEDGARYFVLLDGPGSDGDVRLTPENGVEGSAYALFVAPRAASLHIGTTPDNQVHLALTVLAPRADTSFHFDILDGGLYVRSLDANPARLAADAATACDPGVWQPGRPTGRTQRTSGGQINHWPFTRAYPDSAFPGQPLE